MRIPAALYPFNSDVLSVVKYFEKLQLKYKLNMLIAPPGLGLTGKDAAYSCNHPDLGILVTDNLGLNEGTWEVLILTCGDSENSDDANARERVIKNTFQSGKSIAYFDKNSAAVPNSILELRDILPDKIKIHTGDTYVHLSQNQGSFYCNINTPVILVGGLLTEADTFEVLLNLISNFRADGLHPVGLSMHPIGQLFGLYNMTHIFDDINLCEAEKIAKLNSFIKGVELSEAPDVIIIEAPDAVMRYNDLAPNGFGILTYMLCQAVAPDYFICCVLCDLGVGQFLNAISSKFSDLLGSPIHAAHVSNLFIDSADLLQTHKISCVHVDLNVVRDHIARENASSPIKLFNVVEDDTGELYKFLRTVMINGM